MKELTLKISEKKLPFFLELVKQLGVEVVDNHPEIPKWQKEQVQKSKIELQKDEAEIVEWNEIKKDLFDKYADK